MEDWVTQSLNRKWVFAGRAARQTDKRWSKFILDWKPNRGTGRDRGRPRTRWGDEIVAIAGGNWMETAADEEACDLLKDGFIYGAV